MDQFQFIVSRDSFKRLINNINAKSDMKEWFNGGLTFNVNVKTLKVVITLLTSRKILFD